MAKPMRGFAKRGGMFDTAAIQIWVQPATNQSLGRCRKNRQNDDPEYDEKRRNFEKVVPVRDKCLKEEDAASSNGGDDQGLGKPPMNNEPEVH